MKTILGAEGKYSTIEKNRKSLEYCGYTVITTNTIAQAREYIIRINPDAIVLEHRLSDGFFGLDLLKELRKNDNVTPILLISAQNKQSDIVHGLRAGANDCISKHVACEMLLAHIESLFRNAQRVPERVTCGTLSFDIFSSQAFIKDVNMMLNPKEFALLLLFSQNENKTMHAEYLYRKVWGEPMIYNKNALHTMVSRLRRKLESTGYFIHSLYGDGYVFNAKLELKQAIADTKYKII